MSKKNRPDYIFETSWEVCNMVGGIYTVLSTRAATLQKQHTDKIIFIGPDIWEDKSNPYFESSEEVLAGFTAYTLDNYQLHIKTGRWKIPGEPIAVLVDFSPLLLKKNDIYGHIWEQVGVNSLAAYGDYDESSMFGYATGIIMQSLYHFLELNENHQVVAHFNEWMTTFGGFYVKEHLPQIATIFTTHATSIGRSIAGNHKPLYDYLNEYNGDQMAYELNMVSKHSTEKISAHTVDCFTTVSDITAIECKQLLDIKPHVVTPNGFEDDFVPKAKEFTVKRKESRKLLRKVAETLLGYPLQDDALYIGTSGRYEYKNKGIDIFIESLKDLNQTLEADKQVVAFIMVPAWAKSYREDLLHSLQHADSPLNSYNRTTTHELHDYQNDNVIKALNWFHLHNNEQDKVKVIFVPSYLNGSDGIFNKTYYDLLIGLDMTVFPSYYEPWGYTPLESVAFSVPTVTTCLSGFGQWVSVVPQDIIEGVGVIQRSDYNGHEVAQQISEMVRKVSLMNKDEIRHIRKKAAAISEKALWKHFIHAYETAYDLAISRKNKRFDIFSSK